MCEPKFRKGELGDKADKGPKRQEGSLLLNDGLAKTDWLCLVSLYVEGFCTWQPQFVLKMVEAD